jgi:hypothetical protein
MLVLALLTDGVDELLVRVAEAERLLVELGRTDRQVQLLGAAAAFCIDRGAAGAARTLLSRARPIVESRDNPNDLAGVLGNEGLAALLDGDEDAAEAAFRRELVLATQLRIQLLRAEALYGLAAVAAVRHLDELAAQLLGAGAAARTADSMKLPADARLEQLLAPARERLGTEWDEQFRTGSAMTAHEVAALTESLTAGSPADV